MRRQSENKRITQGSILYLRLNKKYTTPFQIESIRQRISKLRN